MMLAKAAAKLATGRSAVKPNTPWANTRRADELLKRPHGPMIDRGRRPFGRKAPLSFHKPTGRK